MPPGLAAMVVQTQALFTIVFAALAAGERPTGRQWAGTAVAFAGLAVIAATVGHDLTAIGLGLTAMSAVSWGVGNVLVKRLPAVDTLALAVWLSLVPPLPGLALAILWDGPRALWDSWLGASWLGASWLALGAILYLGVVATRSCSASDSARAAGMGLVLLGLAVIVRPGAAGVTEPPPRSR